MTREILLRPQAEADLETIADYTLEQWGNAQARQYVSDIRQAIERLATNGMRPPEESAIYPGLRRMRSGHHFVFYLIDEQRVEVVRVLHERRDAAKHIR